MTNWRAMANDALRDQDNSDNSANRATDGGENGPIVSIGPIVSTSPLVRLKGWRVSLAGVDPCQPVGMAMGRWQTLYDASVWWLDAFGEQAARDGWSTSDVFGVSPYGEGVGGLIDRLGDNRSLVMSSDLAAWRSWGAARNLKRTGCGDLPAWWGIEK